MPVTIVFANEDNDDLNERFRFENEEEDLVLKPFVEKDFFLPITVTVTVKVGRDVAIEDMKVDNLDHVIETALEAGGHETDWQWFKGHQAWVEEDVLSNEGTIKKKMDIDWDTTHCDVCLKQEVYCLIVPDGYEEGEPSGEPWRMSGDGYRVILDMSEHLRTVVSKFKGFRDAFIPIDLADSFQGLEKKLRRAQDKVSKLQQFVAEGTLEIWRDFFACPLPIGQATLFLATALPSGFVTEERVPSRWGKVTIKKLTIEVPWLNDGWEDAIELRDDHGKSLSWRWAPFQREALMMEFDKWISVYCAPILAVYGESKSE